MATETFIWRTQKSAQGTDTVRTLQAQFGDGYKQVAANGINANAETWSLSWTGNKTDAATIRQFLLSHFIASFWWTNPWGEKYLWRVKSDSVSVNFPAGNKATLSFTFERAFAP
uniref:phage tail protein n=1 Tax=Rahnella sp. RFA10(1/100) TaxID=2511202 RepID=UPI00102233C8|nr:phage tail protein [Rahnella sp. RFA10(1/100)]